MEKRKWLGWVMTVLMAAGSSGCFSSEARRQDPGPSQPPPKDSSEPLPVGTCRGDDCEVDRSALALPDHCPTGQCDPDANGQGIFIAGGWGYCLRYMGSLAYCPEAFANSPAGVVLKVRYLSNPTRLVDTRVGIRRRSGTPGSSADALELLSVSSEGTELVIRYRTRDRQVVAARGADLSGLELTFSVDDPDIGDIPQPYDLRVEAVPREGTAAKGPSRYKLSYATTTAWQPHCDGEPVTFLGGRQVDGLRASVVLNHDSLSLTTLSCESGAVATCLAWGYLPWNPSTGRDDPTRDYLFRSCIQAKRAAYFVGQGDLRSYTRSGTLIDKRDQLGINRDRLARPEAIWSPQGAVCLNPENLRRPELGAAANTHGLRPCTPLEWSRRGKLATGPATP
ncbi:ADYC domain-containing protein [Pyxidicoccus sp. MSG2]|uniref:ADYC domain-containing protein n=1 Tax=Pyxidicoccus sp. MSG2 TaxID=2996790 RepID=UPI0022716376|nr:ADYC domain-containing protein [Pyxidicoccus sp. MSG2]MCY1021433.1 ADYC domain-containing protein [Pyxidicoccus sp. MSG2]